ncbi:MAG: CvpA family protein [FCB group bacterium]|nr:CvpA family protein [FCB group bacterium]
MPLSLIDLLSLLLMAGTGYLGYQRGALAELSQLGALLLALILSLWLSGPLATLIIHLVPGLNRWALGLLFALIFVLFYLALRLAFRVLEYLTAGPIRWFDRLGGVLVGAVKGAILIAAAALVLELFSGHRWIQIIRRESVVVNSLYTLQLKVVKTLHRQLPVQPESKPEGLEI